MKQRTNRLADNLLPVAYGTLEGIARELWNGSTRWLVDQCSRSVFVPVSLPLYHEVRSFALHHPSTQKVTRFTAGRLDKEAGIYTLHPGTDTRFLRLDGRLVLFRFHGGMYEEPDQKNKGKSSCAPEAIEPMNYATASSPLMTSVRNLPPGVELTLFGAKRPSELTDVLAAISAQAQARRTGRKTHTIYESNGSYWSELMEKPVRPPESVILPDGWTMDELIADVQQFEAERAWYERMGIPHRRGYLFEGLPGTGKSSAIAGIAAALEKDLYILRLAERDMTDRSLTKLFLNLPSHPTSISMVLIEDTDAAFAPEIDEEARRHTAGDGSKSVYAGEYEGEDDSAPNRRSRSGLSFSGVLNALDGPLAGDGRAVFMTTNHVKLLDPALIRPGRVDVRVNFGHATEKQIARLYERFFPDEPLESAQQIAATLAPRELVMASVQEHFLRYRHSARDAHLYLDDVQPPKAEDVAR